MAVKRISAEFVYTLENDEPIRNGYVEYDTEDGTVLGVGQCDEGEEVLPGAIVQMRVRKYFPVQ